MADRWEGFVERWSAAAVIDADTAARIRAYERTHAGSNRLQWPIWIALAFGVVALGAGALLFVAAHWDALSPSIRFGMVLTLVGVFHVAGALVSTRFPAMAAALHTLGTIALGGGIYLAGQIFNLDEHWPGGLMLWAFGAALAWAILKSPLQLVLTAMLAPAWLAAEWMVAVNFKGSRHEALVLAGGGLLLALAYLNADGGERPDLHRRALSWLGTLWTPLAAIALAVAAGESWRDSLATADALAIVGLVGALGIPLAVAALSRGLRGWPIAVAAVWIVVLTQLQPTSIDIERYAWWMVGATGLAAWGVAEARRGMINLGMAAFALTVMVFYFSHVMDMLSRSTSLISLGLVFLLGGWLIERVRRQLVRRIA